MKEKNRKNIKITIHLIKSLIQEWIYIYLSDKKKILLEPQIISLIFRSKQRIKITFIIRIMYSLNPIIDYLSVFNVMWCLGKARQKIKFAAILWGETDSLDYYKHRWK